MKINIKKIGIGVGAALILIGGSVGFSQPGSQSDPLVTFSYVENRFEEIKEYINQKVGEPGKNNGEQSIWKVVNVSGGKSLIGKAGTEIILRSGQGIAISNISNGLSDVTMGEDLKMGTNIAKDHMLIIPRDDGRGVKCTVDSIFMVKGDYTIK